MALVAGVALTGCSAGPGEEPPGTPTGLTGGGAGGSVADGALEEGETLSPFANDHPAISGLDPALREAMQAAAADAEADGVPMWVTSGWRSAELQAALFEEAERTYGSTAEAARWVASPERSAHVTGTAVDLGPTDANSWLTQHGNAYGLCMRYGNEMWHFELLVEPGEVCPMPLSDASEAEF